MYNDSINRRKVDFTTSGRMAKHLEILTEIWSVFYEMGAQSRKKVLLSEELDEATREKLKVIIEKRGGQIVTKEDEASHIVYGSPPKSATSDGVCCHVWFINDTKPEININNVTEIINL